MRSSVLLIYTGGTIGMKTDATTGALVPFDFNHIYEEFPSLRKLDVDIEVLPFEPIDSSNASPELWVRLAEIIAQHYNRFDGFVVLHGTDTMSYTSSALSFMLHNLAKPVVFTGSQIPIGVLRTDGRENLITAIEIAAAKDSKGRAEVPEVSLYFQNRLFRANRTTKWSAEELNAFASRNYPPLAEVGVSIQYNHSHIRRPKAGAEFGINTSLVRDIAVIKIFPGLTESVFRAMLASGVRGVILETYGAGNAPQRPWLVDRLKRMTEQGMIVVNITQCSKGRVEMGLYETSLQLIEAGVVNGYDATPESMIAKLMFLLGHDLSRDEIVEKMNQSLRGEITTD